MGKLPSKTNFGDIFDEKKVDEIIKIANRLDEDETVLMVIRQTKNPLKPGSSLITPDTIFATTKKIIIRNPSAFGLRHNIESYSYEQIVDVKLEKGMFSSAIEVNVPGSIYDGYIDAIPKDEADELLKIIYEKMEEIRKAKQTQPTQNQTMSISDEITKLAKLKEQGVISEKEFSKMKQELIKKL